MTEQDLLIYAKEPEKIISPVVCDDLLFWVSSYLTEYEESLAEIDQRVSQAKLSLIEKHQSVAKAEVYLEVEDIYLQQQTIERRIRQLKAFKSNVRRRYEVLSNKLLQNRRY